MGHVATLAPELNADAQVLEWDSSILANESQGTGLFGLTGLWNPSNGTLVLDVQVFVCVCVCVWTAHLALNLSTHTHKPTQTQAPTLSLTHTIL